MRYGPPHTTEAGIQPVKILIEKQAKTLDGQAVFAVLRRRCNVLSYSDILTELRASKCSSASGENDKQCGWVRGGLFFRRECWNDVNGCHLLSKD